MKFAKNYLAAFAALALCPAASAQIFTYDQDFESLDINDGAALSGDGWLTYTNVFDGSGNFAYGYSSGGAPNGGSGYSVIGTGLGGAAQGSQYVNVYSDYGNGDHANGFTIESNVYRERGIDASNVGELFTFEFDYLKNPQVINGDGPTEAYAFLKVLQSSNGSFATLAQVNFDTTAASTTAWATGSLQLTIDPAWQGELFQFGFYSTATNYDDSSRLYDNLNVSSPNSRPPGIAPYAQNFEALDLTASDSLSNDGWLSFVNVFDGTGGYLYGYGPFGSANGGAFITALATGAGGPDQGSVYMNVYSDYGNGDHAVGNLINALAFQEQEIAQANVGATYRFSFDVLKDPVPNNGDGQTTSEAFIKVLRRSDGSFAELGIDTFDTTNASTTAWGEGFVEITIDPAWAGELLQFGFSNVVTNYDDSGRFYDNLVFGESSLGTNYCTAAANSTGAPASISAAGSDSAAANNLTLSADGMPSNQFGIFIVSPTQGFNAGVGGSSNGNLCLSGSIGRYRGPGEILSTGAAGSFVLPIDLTAIPQGAGTVPTSAGQTWNFQAWYRDGVGAGSNLTNGIEILFQ